MAEVYSSVAELPPGFHVCKRPTLPLPDRVLMCTPDHFDVRDVKNPFMKDQVGKVDKAKAREQWGSLCSAFESAGTTVEKLVPLAGCDDMVFTANPTFSGLDSQGRRVCVLARMKHPSRQAEVPSHALWYRRQGYAVDSPAGNQSYEGGGDTVWHPGRALIWGAIGERTGGDAYSWISQRFGMPVLQLRMTREPFYHLDTCFAALDEKTVLIFPAALSAESVALIRSQFERVIEAPEKEAVSGMACNSAGVGAKRVIIPTGNPQTAAAVRSAGFEVIEADTSEFCRSGGSVYCLKAYVF